MIKNHYEEVLKHLGNASLCVVSKMRSNEEILSYYEAGERIFAENRAQDFTAKAKQLPDDICWHFIGHLQRNKVAMILPYVSCIQSLDSSALAKVIEKEAAKLNRTIDCLIEFHLAEEDTNKTGLSIEEGLALLKECEAYPHIRICGMMAMGPHTENTERIAEVFQKAHTLFLNIRETHPDFRTLSMGMSHDYKIALENGSTMVRIGTYLFEEQETLYGIHEKKR